MAGKDYSERDLAVAEKLSGLTTAIENLTSHVVGLKEDKEKTHDAMWSKINDHSDKLTKHWAFIRWGMFVGTLLASVLGYMYDKITILFQNIQNLNK